ncbi:solute carrier family 22 member 8 [Elysia marginata]|uniref:Solute carrier family 22 member 8 n=1 Tax=Elysia marginata TaxID=1093978 RepID=A0AAV4FUS2_9GAST|nr:solute carrier family 22 member 8 [Elysia marginata]
MFAIESMTKVRDLAGCDAVDEPEWSCSGATLPDGILYQDQELQEIYVNRSYLVETCAVNGSSCSSFEFDTSSRTVVNEWSLICDYKWIPSTLISIQMGGVLVGAVVAGQLSERWGRRKCITIASAWHVCANVAAACSVSWEMFAVGRFLIGIGIGGIYTNTFPYSMEFLPLKHRGSVALFPFWTFGVAIFVGFAYFLPNWRYLHFGCAAFCLPSFALWFIVPESIRWLTVEGRLNEAMAAIEKMAKWNGKPVPPDARATLEVRLDAHSRCFLVLLVVVVVVIVVLLVVVIIVVVVAAAAAAVVVVVVVVVIVVVVVVVEVVTSSLFYYYYYYY